MHSQLSLEINIRSLRRLFLLMLQYGQIWGIFSIFLEKMTFSLNIFRTTPRIVMIFSLAKRTMLGDVVRHLEHLHTVRGSFSSDTRSQRFPWKMSLFEVLTRTFRTFKTWENSMFLLLLGNFLFYVSYGHNFSLAERTMLGEAVRCLRHLRCVEVSLATLEVNVFLEKASFRGFDQNLQKHDNYHKS